MKHARRIEAQARRRWARGMKGYEVWADRQAVSLGGFYGYTSPEDARRDLRPILDNLFPIGGPRNVRLRRSRTMLR